MTLTGNRWGALTLLGKEWEPLILKGPQGNYIADPQHRLMLHLRCDCGREIKIAKDEFPGRRHMRNCGDPLCPMLELAKEQQAEKKRVKTLGRPVTVDGVSHSIYLPRGLSQGVTAYAKRHGKAVSAIVAELLAPALEQLLLDED